MTKTINYWSFISYSHKDKIWGDWLHKQLETFALPKTARNSISGIGKNLYPIFRDREELPGSADLGANISQALKNSRTLLVICSPRSAKSLWVNQEILNYQELSPEQPIIALVVEGDIENPQSENYCLPNAVKELLDSHSAALVDARQTGKCHALKLELVSKIIQVDLDEFIASVIKHRRIRKLLTATLVAVLVAGSWFAWNAIKQSQLDSLIAESERLSVIAEQALKSDDDSKALNNALAALPRNIEIPGQPVNPKAAAVLNRLMSKPLLMLERGKITRQIKGLKATDDGMLWLVTDTLGGIHLFDLKIGKARWTIEEPGHLISEINSHQQLIVRGKSGLKNYNSTTGKLNCEIALDTHPHLGLKGSLDWMQKDWVMESEGHTTKGNPEKFIADSYTPRQVKFVNSKNCESTPLSSIGFAVHSNLVDVLPDGSKITVTDSYIDGNPISGFQRWPDVDKPVPEYLFHLSGHSESFIAGYHNSQEYNGPLIKTSAKENMSFIALKTNDQQGFVLTKFDWLNKKVVTRQMLPSLPEKIYWQNEKQINILVLIQKIGSSTQETKSTYALDTPHIRVYNTNDLAYIKEATVERNYLANAFSPSLDYLISLDSFINIKHLKTNESFSRKRSQITQWNNVGWLDENTLIMAEQDGRILSVEINQDIILNKLKTEKCCYRSVDSRAGLVQAYNGALYQFKTEQKQISAESENSNILENVIYEPEHYEINYRYVVNHDLIFIDEVLKNDKESNLSQQQHSFQLMRLSDQKVLWRIIQQDPININEQYLSYQEDDQMVIIHYNNPLEPVKLSLPEDLISFQYNNDASQLIGIKYTPDYLSSSDGLLHVVRYDVATNMQIEDINFDLGRVLLTDKFFIFPELALVAYIGTSTDKNETEDQKTHLKLLSLNEQQIEDFGSLPNSIAHSFSSSLEIFDEYIKIVPSAILGVGDTLLIERAIKKQNFFTGGDQVWIKKGLMQKDRVFLTNLASKRLQLLNMEDSNMQDLDCPFNGTLNEILPLQETGLLAIRTESLCIIDPNTWQTLMVVNATQSSSEISRYAGTQQIGGLVKNSGKQLTAFTGNNIAISVSVDFDWRKSIVKANQLLLLGQE